MKNKTKERDETNYIFFRPELWASVKSLSDVCRSRITAEVRMMNDDGFGYSAPPRGRRKVRRTRPLFVDNTRYITGIYNIIIHAPYKILRQTFNIYATPPSAKHVLYRGPSAQK